MSGTFGSSFGPTFDNGVDPKQGTGSATSLVNVGSSTAESPAGSAYSVVNAMAEVPNGAAYSVVNVGVPVVEASAGSAYSVVNSVVPVQSGTISDDVQLFATISVTSPGRPEQDAVGSLDQVVTPPMPGPLPDAVAYVDLRATLVESPDAVAYVESNTPPPLIADPSAVAYLDQNTSFIVTPDPSAVGYIDGNTTNALGLDVTVGGAVQVARQLSSTISTDIDLSGHAVDVHAGSSTVDADVQVTGSILMQRGLFAKVTEPDVQITGRISKPRPLSSTVSTDLSLSATVTRSLSLSGTSAAADLELAATLTKELHYVYLSSTIDGGVEPSAGAVLQPGEKGLSSTGRGVEADILLGGIYLVIVQGLPWWYQWWWQTTIGTGVGTGGGTVYGGSGSASGYGMDQSYWDSYYAHLTVAGLHKRRRVSFDP